MRLNMDCIRDILLTVEERSAYRSMIFFPHVKEQAERLATYSDDEILYHVRQCDQSGLLFGVRYAPNETIIVQDLRPEGHSFLSDIRPISAWKRAKEIATDVGATALDVMINIASQVTAELISSRLPGYTP